MCVVGVGYIAIVGQISLEVPNGVPGPAAPKLRCTRWGGVCCRFEATVAGGLLESKN